MTDFLRFLEYTRGRSKCKYTIRGRYEYTDDDNVTCSGQECLHWGMVWRKLNTKPRLEQTPDRLSIRSTSQDFPIDGGMYEASNYCRNPLLDTAGKVRPLLSSIVISEIFF